MSTDDRILDIDQLVGDAPQIRLFGELRDVLIVPNMDTIQLKRFTDIQQAAQTAAEDEETSYQIMDQQIAFVVPSLTDEEVQRMTIRQKKAVLVFFTTETQAATAAELADVQELAALTESEQTS